MIASCVQNSSHCASMYFISNTSLHCYSWWGKRPIWLMTFWNCTQYWMFVLCLVMSVWMLTPHPPSIELAFIYRLVLCKRFLKCLCGLFWCQLANVNWSFKLNVSHLTVKAMSSFNSQFDWYFIIALQEGKIKQGFTYL